jgi:hypothetical protein
MKKDLECNAEKVIWTSNTALKYKLSHGIYIIVPNPAIGNVCSSTRS